MLNSWVWVIEILTRAYMWSCVSVYAYLYIAVILVNKKNDIFS